MHRVTLDHETDFAGWRRAARALVLNGVPPSEVDWRVRDAREPQARAIAPESPHDTFSVPAKFVALAKHVILHRSRHRFALLYRLLWRLCRHHDLLMATDDPDVAGASAMADAVRRDIPGCRQACASAKSAVSRRRITSPGLRRSITSWR